MFDAWTNTPKFCLDFSKSQYFEMKAIQIFFSLFENRKRKTKREEHPLNIFPLHTNDHLRREKKQQECAKDTLGSWNHCIKRGVNLKDIVFSYSMHGRPWLLQFDKWNPNIFDTKKQRVSKFKVLQFDLSHSKTPMFFTHGLSRREMKGNRTMGLFLISIAY